MLWIQDQTENHMTIRKRSNVVLGAGIVLLLGGAGFAAYLGGDFDLSWYTIDGGGGGESTGGDFALAGTIGQPDAGTMSGGDFELAGGFWPGASVSTGGCVRNPQWVCDGDTDGDGQVNPVDAGLVQAAFGSADESDLCQYDIDCDGQINPVDSGIVQSLFGTCEEPRSECP